MMHKNLNGSNAICRSLLEQAVANKKQQDVMMSLLIEQRDENRKMSSIFKARIPDINQFFPIKNNDDLARFLDTSDGLYPLRRSEFYNRILSLLSDKNNLFGTALLNSCFSEDYIKNHVWPTNGYDY